MHTDTIEFLGTDGSFHLKNADRYSDLYFPIAGKHLKSAVTPTFGGDAKLDQNHFLLEPVSVENLHNNRSARAFWCRTEKGIWSALAEGESTLEAGFMWQKVSRRNELTGLSCEVTMFIPQTDEKDTEMEVLLVQITNQKEEPVEFRPTAVVPLYGRSASNIRDHRDVTSMLNRAVTIREGVVLKPTLSFDERGHLPNTVTYFVCGYAFSGYGAGTAPEDLYPVSSGYIGEGGNFSAPRSVIEDWQGLPAGTRVDGQEVTGGLHFQKTVLEPGQSASFVIVTGAIDELQQTGAGEAALHLPWKDAAPDSRTVSRLIAPYQSLDYVQKALERTKKYWQEQVNASFHTNDVRFDNFLKWVSFQPILRRIYGCSFLPHHDYGKGGRGWRDLWQDCLALLLMDPDGVRELILSNFDGVRLDGTNATIIGDMPGEFKADRNAITRVWMDHGYWPLGTVKLYIDQTGDFSILEEQAGYFKDRQIMRALETDAEWTDSYGTAQKDKEGILYRGTVLEHLLIQNICACLELGEHGILRLRDADWNDALDMAGERGESVAFSSAYAGNLKELADLITLYASQSGLQELETAQEMELLFEETEDGDSCLYNYLSAVRHDVTGKKVSLSIDRIVHVLQKRAEELMQLIRSQEWVEDGEGNGWFNSYYDNNGRRVEGIVNGQVRMMLTGQVFAVMSGTATEAQAREIARSADRYLYDKAAGGYRLNTDFGEVKTDLGRMFGFAYGEKENGAVFSHMTVMYANALYSRGLVAEGNKALKTLADTALQFETSHIYPGIPEYFSSNVIRPLAADTDREAISDALGYPGVSRMGRGRYHYLTGAASWYMLTMITQVFGVRGHSGDLLLEPKLTEAQFDQAGEAKVTCLFAGRMIEVTYRNPENCSYGSYVIKQVMLNGEIVTLDGNDPNKVLIARDQIERNRINEEAAEDVLKLDVLLGSQE